MLRIKNLHAGIPGKEIIHGLDLTIKAGEVHAIMGPNGSGKTTLAMSLMGHPGYIITSQISNLKSKNVDIKTRNTKPVVEIDGENIVGLLPEERARLGLFVSFQSPVEITGVSFLAFLRTASKALYPTQKELLAEFKKRVKDALKTVALREDFMSRSVNEGFSGGERKRAEIAQLLVLKPKFIILDEIDSGLDVDSLKVVAEAMSKAVKEYQMAVLVITHYQRILHFLKPDHVHILMDGVIKKSGGIRLVHTIEKEGYGAI